MRPGLWDALEMSQPNTQGKTTLKRLRGLRGESVCVAGASVCGVGARHLLNLNLEKRKRDVQ